MCFPLRDVKELAINLSKLDGQLSSATINDSQRTEFKQVIPMPTG